MSTILTDSGLPNTSIVAQKYKLVFLGDQSVGKTSIINRFIFDTFDGKDHVNYPFSIIIKHSPL